MSLNAFTPDGTYAVLSAGSGVGAKTAQVTIPAGAGTAVLVTNSGPAAAVVVIGANAAGAQIATADLAHGICIPSGGSIALAKGTNTVLGACAVGGQLAANLNLASGT